MIAPLRESVRIPGAKDRRNRPRSRGNRVKVTGIGLHAPYRLSDVNGFDPDIHNGASPGAAGDVR
jgi:hypothetical protein